MKAQRFDAGDEILISGQHNGHFWLSHHCKSRCLTLGFGGRQGQSRAAYQSNTRKARSVFHRLGRPSPSSSAKCTAPGWVFSKKPRAVRLLPGPEQSHRFIQARVRRIPNRPEVLQSTQHVVVPAGRKRELEPGRVDDGAGALPPEQLPFQEVRLTPAARRGGFRRAAGGALVG